ncbi:hypothetical protein AB5I83_06665 [Mesobacillus sp. LC4]
MLNKNTNKAIIKMGEENMIILVLVVLNALVGHLFIQNLIEAIKINDKEEGEKKKINASINFVLWTFSIIFIITLFIGGYSKIQRSKRQF